MSDKALTKSVTTPSGLEVPPDNSRRVTRSQKQDSMPTGKKPEHHSITGAVRSKLTADGRNGSRSAPSQPNSTLVVNTSLPAPIASKKGSKSKKLSATPSSTSTTIGDESPLSHPTSSLRPEGKSHCDVDNATAGFPISVTFISSSGQHSNNQNVSNNSLQNSRVEQSKYSNDYHTHTQNETVNERVNDIQDNF